MTFRVELAARAQRDLRRLFVRIRAAESRQSRAWFDGLEATILSLDEAPSRGLTAQEDDRLRQLIYGHGRNIFRVIYRIDDENAVVTVVHIRFGARRPMEIGDVEYEATMPKVVREAPRALAGDTTHGRLFHRSRQPRHRLFQLKLSPELFFDDHRITTNPFVDHETRFRDRQTAVAGRGAPGARRSG